MEHFLFAAYLVFFAWLITKTPFFTASGFTTPQLVILFLLKVMAGILYGWIGVWYGQIGQMMDTWAYHIESIKEYHLLLNEPKDFFTNLFHTTYTDGYTKFLSTENSWWNDLKGNLLLKLFALFNVFSFGHYFINVIFYSFITLCAPIAVYRVMTDVFPAGKLPILLATFLMPSVLYWTSGLYKDGLVFLGLALVIFNVYFGLKSNHFTLRRIVFIVLSLLLVMVLRSFLIIPTLPALAAWMLAHRLKKNPLLVFGVIYTAFMVLFFTAKFIHPRLNFPQDVVDRQDAFLKLGGGSAVAVQRLEPTVGSFVINAPQAFALSTVRPYPSDVHHLLSLAASTEINLLLLLFILLLIWPKRAQARNPFLVFCLFFSFSVLMMIGYSVDVLGAIVRYRSIVLSFLVVPMVAKIDWEKVGRWFFANIESK